MKKHERGNKIRINEKKAEKMTERKSERGRERERRSLLLWLAAYCGLFDEAIMDHD